MRNLNLKNDQVVQFFCTWLVPPEDMIILWPSGKMLQPNVDRMNLIYPLTCYRSNVSQYIAVFLWNMSDCNAMERLAENHNLWDTQWEGYTQNLR